MNYLNNHDIKILVLEENESDFKILEDMIGEFSFNNYQINRSKTLGGFLTRLKIDSFDICLTGSYQSEKSFLNLREELLPQLLNSPILMLADDRNRSICEQAILNDLADFINKWDFDSKSLERIILHTIQHHRILSELTESNTRYQSLIESLPVMFYTSEITPPYKPIYVSPSYSQFGYPIKDWLYKEHFWVNNLHPDDHDRVIEETNLAMLNGEETNYEYRLKAADDTYHWVHDRGRFYRNSRGEIEYWQGIMSDISERKLVEEELLHRAMFDELTDLPNRANFLKNLNQAISEHESDRSNFAVFILDIDRFKAINDSLGHFVGDLLLIELSKRLRKIIRKTDVVARFGGDEFTILVKRIAHINDVTIIAKQIIDAISMPFVIENYRISTSASVGINFADLNNRSSEKYLRDADTAMYKAKENGKNCYVIFDQSMHIKSMNSFRIENDLRQAIERNELEVYYQPIFSFETGEMKKMEALIRWNHTVHGEIPPSEFIPIAEETGLIGSIGFWAMKESCKQLKAWQSRFQQCENLTVCVNISAKQLAWFDLLEKIRNIIREADIEPKYLNLEITETALVKHDSTTLEALSVLNSMGIDLLMDDFGIGYSCLSYLHTLPFSKLKIDMSFIQNIGKDSKSERIIRTILQLARGLGYSVVAEGIETKEQYDYLLNIGCDFGQGYYLSKPLSVSEAEEFFQNLTARPTDVFAPAFVLPANQITLETTNGIH